MDLRFMQREWGFRFLQNFCVILARKKKVRKRIAKSKEILCIFNDFINKTKIEICKEVLRDVSQNFDGVEEFIKQRIEKVCDRKKTSVL